MITEKEFELLTRLKDSPFIKREDFDSDDNFDYTCKIARELLNRGVIHSRSSKPFVTNNTGKGSHYSIAGKFTLSDIALDAISVETYMVYKKLQAKELNWSLGNRLTALSVLVALISIVVALIYA